MTVLIGSRAILRPKSNILAAESDFRCVAGDGGCASVFLLGREIQVYTLLPARTGSEFGVRGSASRRCPAVKDSRVSVTIERYRKAL